MTGIVTTQPVQGLIDVAHQMHRAMQKERNWANHGTPPTFFGDLAEHYAPLGISLTMRQRQLLPQLWAYDCGNQDRIAVRLTPEGDMRGIVVPPEQQYPAMDFRQSINDSHTDVMVRLMGITPMEVVEGVGESMKRGALAAWFNEPIFAETRSLASSIRQSQEYQEALKQFQEQTALLPQVQVAAKIIGPLEWGLFKGIAIPSWPALFLEGGFLMHHSSRRDDGSGNWLIGVPKGTDARLCGKEVKAGLYIMRGGFEISTGEHAYVVTEDGLSTVSGTRITDWEGYLLE